MIPSDFYPTLYTSAAQNIETTASVSNIPVKIPDFTGAYYLGWVGYDNFPDCWRIGTYEENGSEIVFSDATKAENFDMGYFCAFGSQNDLVYNMLLKHTYDSATGRWRLFEHNEVAIADYGSFPNKQDVNCNAAASITLTFIVVAFVNSNPSSYSLGTLTASTIDIVSGFTDKTLSISTYSGSFPSGLTVTVSSDELDGTVYTKNIDGYDVKIAFVGINPAFLRGITTAGGASNFIFSKPFVKMHDVNDVPFVVAGGSFGGAYPIKTDGTVYRAYGTYDSNFGANCTFGGFSGVLLVSMIGDLALYDIVQPDGANFALHHYATSGPFYHVVRRIFSWEDARKICALQIRWSAGSNTYDNGTDKYYPLVSDSNEFLLDFANGVTDFVKLREWQKIGAVVDGTTAEYTEDDKPPYIPPEEDDKQNVGASVLRPSTLGVGGTSGFITQYVLTAAEIATLGRTLWTSFINPDYWHNFLFSLALDTGSFNMASLLDYFVSLRVYPFSLINVPSYAATGSPSIYIGSGVVPLTITGSTTLHTINNFADYIDAGSCVVHSAYFHDDFRDFSNVEIMLYLPYCGTVQLNPGDVVGGTLHAQYAIDFATGGCVAYVDLTSADGISYPIAVLPGSIGADVPLTATNAGQIAARFAGDVINFASTVTSNAASDLNARASAATGAITGGPSGALSRASSGIGTIATGGINAGLQHASQALDMATRPAIGIPTLSGGRGFSSFGAPQTAYIQIRRGIYKRPQTYDHTVGSPSSASKMIGSLAGLVKGAVDTAGLSCTADEAAEVRTLIAAGIII